MNNISKILAVLFVSVAPFLIFMFLGVSLGVKIPWLFGFSIEAGMWFIYCVIYIDLSSRKDLKI